MAKRLRLADRETMAIETLHVRAALVPGLSAADLERGSFYELLRERYGVAIAGGVQSIEPTVTNEEESSALGVPLHSPAFLFERFSRDESGAIVEFVHSIYRGDRYRLVTDLSSRGELGPGACPGCRARTASGSAEASWSRPTCGGQGRMVQRKTREWS